jgi:hypothetical protein
LARTVVVVVVVEADWVLSLVVCGGFGGCGEVMLWWVGADGSGGGGGRCCEFLGVLAFFFPERFYEF